MSGGVRCNIENKTVMNLQSSAGLYATLVPVPTPSLNRVDEEKDALKLKNPRRWSGSKMAVC